MSELTYRALDSRDVAKAARLHETAFPGYFLSTLGVRFLREFYRGFLADPSAVTVVAIAEDGKLDGVVVGTTEPAGFYRHLLLRRGVFFALAGIRVVLRRPSIVPRLVRALVYRGAVPAENLPAETRGALLSSICVAPAMQGKKIGRQLIDRWVDEVSTQGLNEAYLTTDADDNDQAIGFYKRMGWVEAGSYTTREGRVMSCFVWAGGATEEKP